MAVNIFSSFSAERINNLAFVQLFGTVHWTTKGL